MTNIYGSRSEEEQIIKKSSEVLGRQQIVKSTVNVRSKGNPPPLSALKTHCQDLSTLPSHLTLDITLYPHTSSGIFNNLLNILLTLFACIILNISFMIFSSHLQKNLLLPQRKILIAVKSCILKKEMSYPEN